MDDPELQVVIDTAERFDELADVAELMDDIDGARRLRGQASAARRRAMHLLDG